MGVTEVFRLAVAALAMATAAACGAPATSWHGSPPPPVPSPGSVAAPPPPSPSPSTSPSPAAAVAVPAGVSAGIVVYDRVAGDQRRRRRPDTTGTVGAGDRTIVVVLTAHRPGTSFARATAVVTALTRSLPLAP